MKSLRSADRINPDPSVQSLEGIGASIRLALGEIDRHARVGLDVEQKDASILICEARRSDELPVA